MRSSALAVLLFAALTAAFSVGQSREPGARQSRRTSAATRPAQEARFLTDVPAHAFDVILGRPTANSITMSVLLYADAQCYIAYGNQPDRLTARTELRNCTAGEPVEIVLCALQVNTQYYYELRQPASEQAVASGRFHTQRPPGSTYTFTIQADSHLDEHTSPPLYRQTLRNVLADQPDFHIDLGDTFMTEKHVDRADAAKQYVAQRYYFGLVGTSVPVFLVLGNHDGEGCRQVDGTSDSLAVWSNTMRKRYFPNPVPDAFFSGNEAKDKFAGLLQDYYAWTWGDALFVVLDPFWYGSRPRGANDSWARSLGPEQYRWLARTLEKSQSRYKFVFIHHLVGGLDRQGRGGVEAVPFYEWGGKNADGSDGFQAHRPGWDKPIHDLLVRYNVTAVFHGHDHFFAKQELDGIIYQLVPQPGAPRANAMSMAKDCGYVNGDIIPCSGYLRVTVAEASVTIDFMRTLPADGPSTQPTSDEPAYSYSVDGARQR